MGRFLGVLGRSFLVQNLYGSRYAPHIGTFPLPHVYVKAMLYSAASDTINETERRYVQGFVDVVFPCAEQQQYENKMELVHFVESFRKNSADDVVNISFLSGSMMTNPVLARILLYDSIRTCAEDGVYSQPEQVSAARISKQLGIPEVITNKIEAIAQSEVALRERKMALLLNRKLVVE